MNKTDYKNTFSKLHPSASTLERIFEMSERKQGKFDKRGLIAVIAVVSILVASCICANAATDGALASGAKMILNGEDVNIVEYVKNYESYIDENGNKVEKTSFETPDGLRRGSVIVSVDENAENSDNEIVFTFEASDIDKEMQFIIEN